MSTARVSVVMPVHNRDWCVAEAIQSVLATRAEGLELVVVDDGSTDATPVILRTLAARDTRIRVITHRERRGIAASRNHAVSASLGTYLAFLDSDDLYLPSRFAAALDWLDANPQSAGCIEPSATQAFGESGAAQMRAHLTSLPSSGTAWLRAMLFDNLYWPICALTLRRSALECFGSFDESLRFAEETSLWLRLAAADALGVAQREDAVCIVRLHGHHSHDGTDMAAEQAAFLRVLLATLAWLGAQAGADETARDLVRSKLRTTLVEILSDPRLPLSMRVQAWLRAVRACPAIAFERVVAANLARAPWRQRAAHQA